MWIVNQDKDMIINAEKMHSIARSRSYIEAFYSVGYKRLLGIYSSEEKAIKVMESIINAKSPSIIINKSNDFNKRIGDGLIKTSSNGETKFIGSKEIFYMPQDDEVVIDEV